MRKILVAFRPEVLEEVERRLNGEPADPVLLESALRSCAQARALYAGETPGLRLLRTIPEEQRRKYLTGDWETLGTDEEERITPDPEA